MQRPVTGNNPMNELTKELSMGENLSKDTLSKLLGMDDFSPVYQDRKSVV